MNNILGEKKIQNLIYYVYFNLKIIFYFIHLIKIFNILKHDFLKNIGQYLKKRILGESDIWTKFWENAKFKIQVNMFTLILKYLLYYIHFIKLFNSLKHNFSKNIRQNLKKSKLGEIDIWTNFCENAKFKIQVNMFTLILKYVLYYIHLIKLCNSLKHDFSKNICQNSKKK